MQDLIKNAIDKYEQYIGKDVITKWFEKKTAEIAETIKTLSKGNEAPFWLIKDILNNPVMLFDNSSNVLWEFYSQNPNNHRDFNLVKQLVGETKSGELVNWNLPDKDVFLQFAIKSNNPYRKGDNFRLFGEYGFLVNTGYVDLDYSNMFYTAASSRLYILYNTTYVKKSLNEFIDYLIKQKYSISQYNLNIKSDDKIIPHEIFDFDKNGFAELIKDIDYKSVRLESIDKARLCEHDQGLWEFENTDVEIQNKTGIIGRDPALDVKSSSVAIDFGTSSTVVAIEENGRTKLLRIGLKDYNEEPLAEHFENPTVLEFINLEKVLHILTEKAYRPFLDWDYLKASHEAKHNLHYNSTDTKIVASILSKLKQWALREANDNPLILTDQETKFSHELASLVANSPTKGKPLTVDKNYQFDPIEVYALLLGFIINWRNRGIYLNYYMTFPVDYPKDIKEKILSSFRRGLQRSFPENFTTKPEFQNFSVSEAGTEPAAYAAVALSELNIPCTKEGTPYAVFDFGGGTTDFDFGIYRLPTDDEADDDYEQVIEHFYASGDKFLGGENILENLAYLVFKDNIKECRDKQLVITRPLNALGFAGDELLISRSSFASTNMTMLIGQLRAYWETGSFDNKSIADTGILKITLIDKNGGKQDCEFNIKTDILDEYIQNTIEQGVLNFFIAMSNAFKDNSPKTVHILLAGNSSKSKWIANIFGLENEEPVLQPGMLEKIKSHFKDVPSFIIHPALRGDENDVYAPTGKTGVALGLLKICPGGDPILVINRSIEKAEGEAPFLYFVGRIKQNKFVPVIKQGDQYQVWNECGVVREGYFNLVYSQSPTSLSGLVERGDPILKEIKIKMSGNSDSHRVYVKANAPSEVEICTVEKGQMPDNGEKNNIQVFNLDKKS